MVMFGVLITLMKKPKMYQLLLIVSGLKQEKKEIKNIKKYWEIKMSNDTKQSEGIVKEQSRKTIEEIIIDNNTKIYELQQFLSEGTKSLDKITERLNKITEKVQRGF